MKTISSERVRTMLQTMWPNLRMIWLTDPVYKIVPVQELPEIVKQLSVAHMVYIKNLWDCDESALMFHVNAKKYGYDEFFANLREKYPEHYDLAEGQLVREALKQGEAVNREASYAIGECMGTKFIGQMIDHDVNIIITDEGIYFADPQTDEVWKGHEEGDAPFFVKF